MEDLDAVANEAANIEPSPDTEKAKPNNKKVNRNNWDFNCQVFTRSCCVGHYKGFSRKTGWIWYCRLANQTVQFLSFCSWQNNSKWKLLPTRLWVFPYRYFHIFYYLRSCATDDISFSLQRKAADKNGQTKRKANKVTNAGIADVGLTSGNDFDDSIDNLEQQRPKRPKRERPTKSVNENIEPAFTAMPVEALQQPGILPAFDQSSGGFSMSGQNLDSHRQSSL